MALKRLYVCFFLFSSVLIEEGVEEIGVRAFYGCEKLESINIPNSITNIDIPDSVTYIGKRAFAECRQASSIEIGESVKVIGEYAFFRCKGVETIIVPGSVEAIGKNAFAGSSLLRCVIFKGEIETIAERLFASCTSLESIVIPESVVIIEGYAFNSANASVIIYYYGNKESYEKISVNSTGNTVFLSANVFYYSSEEPTTEGSYWHYDENGNVIAW